MAETGITEDHHRKRNQSDFREAVHSLTTPNRDYSTINGLGRSCADKRGFPPGANQNNRNRDPLMSTESTRKQSDKAIVGQRHAKREICCIFTTPGHTWVSLFSISY
jgi:hypothetical protein